MEDSQNGSIINTKFTCIFADENHKELRLKPNELVLNAYTLLARQKNQYKVYTNNIYWSLFSFEVLSRGLDQKYWIKLHIYLVDFGETLKGSEWARTWITLTTKLDFWVHVEDVTRLTYLYSNLIKRPFCALLLHIFIYMRTGSNKKQVSSTSSINFRTLCQNFGLE